MEVQHGQSHEEEVRALREQIDGLTAQLMQAQKMSSVGALASSITHEFNNILTTVINYSKMGLRHKDAASREKAFNKILNAGQRAAKITTGMLAFARGTGNRHEPTDLVGLVEDVLVLVEKDLHVHRINLQTDFTACPWAAVCTHQIQQVLLNLIINARQAMRPGGRMIVSVGENEADGMAEIAVRDSGSGIPADKLPKIFDAFFSTKEVDDGGRGGTGLGLSVCRDVIEAHHGRIRVASTVGQGTTFTLRFPLVATPEGAADQSVSRAG